MSELKAMIDQRQKLEREKDALQKAIDLLSADIIAIMVADGKKQALGTDGTGYSLSGRTTYSYQKPVYELLNAKGLLIHFEQKPKITRAELEDLYKQGALTGAEMDEIARYTIPKESPYSLRRVVPKEARIV